MVVGVGLATPLGVGLDQTATAVRAGVAAHRERPWESSTFQPTVMATLPDDILPAVPIRQEPGMDVNAAEAEARLTALAALALRAVGDTGAGGVPLVLGLPNEAELQGYQSGRVLEALAGVAADRVHGGKSEAICKGRASGLLAVHQACALLQSGQADLVLAGGCDTYRNMARIEALDEAERLNTETNMDGFTPGEGAGFLLLTTEAVSRERGMAPLCKLAGPAEGFEPGHLNSALPYTGEGLSATWQMLLKIRAGPKLEMVYSSMNGEHYWAKELGTACIRCSEYLSSDLTIMHPADCLGDLGAATGPLLVALAAWTISRAQLQRTALVSCSSDLGERASLLVEAVTTR